MSLADELLADLEYMDGGQGPTGDSKEESMETEQVSSAMNFLANKNSVHAVAKLKDSILLQETMKKIEFHTKHQRKST
ncbi:unnamed protein product, partial [Adineta steineri]